ENLVLFAVPDNEEIGYIIKYNTELGILKTETQIRDAGVTYIKTISTEEIENPESGKMQVVWYFGSLCNWYPYNCFGSQCGFGYIPVTMWISDFVPGEAGYVDPGNPGGGGGDTGYQDEEDLDIEDTDHNPIIIAPVMEELVVDPCAKL